MTVTVLVYWGREVIFLIKNIKNTTLYKTKAIYAKCTNLSIL